MFFVIHVFYFVYVIVVVKGSFRLVRNVLSLLEDRYRSNSRNKFNEDAIIIQK